MIIENKKIYKSDDGKEFTTEEACLRHERKVAEKLIKAEKKQKDYDAIIDSIKKFNKEYHTNHRLWVDDTTATATELFDLLFK